MAGFDEILVHLLTENYPTPIHKEISHLQRDTEPLPVNWFAQRLGFVTVQYLSLVGYFDYLHANAHDDAVERALREPGNQRVSMGHWCGLLRAVARFRCGFQLLDIGYSSRVEPAALPNISRFVRGWEYVLSENKKKSPPDRIVRGVDEHLAQRTAGKVSVEDLISGLLDYRNSVAHALENDFPAYDHELTTQLNKWMVPALVELLQYPPVKVVLCDHAWTTPTPAGDVCRPVQRDAIDTSPAVQGDSWEAPAIWQAGLRPRVTIRSEKYFVGGDYLADMRGGVGRLRFKFSYSNAWPTDPKQTTPAPQPEVAGLPLATRAREVFSAVVDMARLDGLTAAKRAHLASIRDLLDLDEASADEVLGQGEPPPPEEAPVPAPRVTSTSPSAAAERAGFVRATLLGVEGILKRALASPQLRFTPSGSADALDVGQGSLTVEISIGTAVAAWFWQDGATIFAVVGYYGGDGNPEEAYLLNVERLKAPGPDLWPGWTFAASKWKKAGYEAFHELPSQPPQPEALARTMARVMLRLIGLLTPDVPCRLGVLDHTALLLGLEPKALGAELVDFAERAVKEKWVAAEQDPMWGWSPWLRRGTLGGFVEGRVGVDLRQEWTPGVFVGVLIDPKDHAVTPSMPLLGADAVVILSTHKSLKGFDRAAYVAAPQFIALRERLARASSGWDFHDHIAVPKPNFWHPVHLRRPLIHVWEGAEDATMRDKRLFNALREGLRVLLEGRELAALEAEKKIAPGEDSPPWWKPGFDAITKAAGTVTTALKPGTGAAWPDAGLEFIVRLHGPATGRLRFKPSEVTEPDEKGPSGSGAFWAHATPKHFVMVSFSEKRSEKVTIALDFSSDNPQRDKKFSEAREAILAELDGPIAGGWEFERQDGAHRSLVATRRVAIAELGEPQLLEDTLAGLEELSRLVAKHLEGATRKR